jgi:hypothetical protein
LPTFDVSPAISQEPENVQLVLNPTLRQRLRHNPRKNFESKVEAV